MKTVRVAAAVIEKDGMILVARRKKGEHAGLFEFPGGKIEEGESGEEAIVREIREEFECELSVRAYLTTVEYDYPSFHLSMDCYLSQLSDGEIRLNDHSEVRWIEPSEEVEWIPADVLVIEEYRKRLL